MLSTSYAAIAQFQRKISKTQTFQELKALLHPYTNLSIRITSSSFWDLEWDLFNQGILGTLEIKLQPLLLLGDKIIPMQEIPFRIEDPHLNSLGGLEKRLFHLIKEAVETFEGY